MASLPAKLTTTIKNIDSIPDLTNTAIVKQFHQFMKDNCHQKDIKIII
jgi:hypothetical protein